MSDNVQIIVKIVERCSLDCSYCSMYHGADQSWNSRPALLSHSLQDALVDRCAAYLDAYEYRSVTLEFHGGEPLMIGLPDFKIRILTQIMKSLFGFHGGLDAFGGELWGMIVVESDGSYQHVDVMRINGLDQVETGLNLVDCNLDAYLGQTRGTMPKASATSKSCSAFHVCGGR